MEWLTDLSAAVLLFSLLMYLMLDGTDLGAGMLIIIFHREEQKRLIVRSMLPIWDANETWLVLLAGGLFALFPAAYSLLFSALYIPLFVMLFCLILRAIALEYRETVAIETRHRLDKLLPLSSALAAYCQGASAGMVVSGTLSADAFAWLGFYPMLSGLGLVTVYLLLGCGWIRWRVAGSVGRETPKLTRILLLLGLALFVIIEYFNPAPLQHLSEHVWGKGLNAMIIMVWISLFVTVSKINSFLHLLLSLILLAAITIQMGMGFYPELIQGQLKLHQTSSDITTQWFVLSGIAFIIPVTLAYHSWAFWVFRGKIEK